MRKTCEKLAWLVRNHRRSMRLTVRQAAAQIGTSPSTLSRIETGDTTMPDLATVGRVAAWLALPIEALYDDESPVKPFRDPDPRAARAGASRGRPKMLRGRRREMQSECTIQAVEQLVRSDPNFDGAGARHVVELFSEAYETHRRR
jgi:transcriptional regulator with XRE-family HTH domain